MNEMKHCFGSALSGSNEMVISKKDLKRCVWDAADGIRIIAIKYFVFHSQTLRRKYAMCWEAWDGASWQPIRHLFKREHFVAIVIARLRHVLQNCCKNCYIHNLLTMTERIRLYRYVLLPLGCKLEQTTEEMEPLDAHHRTFYRSVIEESIGTTFGFQ